jgi:hypothetical protein
LVLFFKKERLAFSTTYQKTAFCIINKTAPYTQQKGLKAPSVPDRTLQACHRADRIECLPATMGLEDHFGLILDPALFLRNPDLRSALAELIGDGTIPD